MSATSNRTHAGTPSHEAIAALFPELDLGEQLGAGGMGFVFAALQRSLARRVALKLMRAECADAARRERFEREARALAKLNHPNIVALYDVGERAGWFYLLMEFVEGEDLARRLRNGPLSPRLALELTTDICEALIHAHGMGVVHRDIKPANVLIGADARAKLADFGLAKHLQAGALSLTGGVTVLGTPHYMSPEQRRDPWSADARADIYALGVMLYEMLTGRLPTGRFAPPSHTANTTPALDEAVQKAMALDPASRFQSVKALRDTIARVGTECGGRAGARGIWTAAAAAVIGAVVVTGVAALGNGIKTTRGKLKVRAVAATSATATPLSISDNAKPKAMPAEKPPPEGRTQVHHTVQSGDVAGLRSVLASNPNLEIADAEGWTPLLLAVSLDRTDLLDALFEKGAKPDAVMPGAASALHVAAAFGATKAAQWLKSHGGDVSARDAAGWHPMEWAAAALQPDMVRWLAAQGAPMKRREDSPMPRPKKRPLHLAAAAGFRTETERPELLPWRIAWKQSDDVARRCTATVLALLELGAATNEQDEHGLTALHNAAMANQVSAVSLLLDRGADPNFLGPASATPLSLAASANATDAMRVLLARGAVVHTVVEPESALHQAARQGALEAVQLLLEQKAQVLVRDTARATPLHRAAERGHVPVVKLLLDHGAEVDGRDAQRATPLHFAARNNHLEAVRLLCESGASVEARMAGGSTPQMLATAAGHSGVAQFLETIAARNNKRNEK